LNYDLYFHRLGRCGRAGAEGRGLLVLLPFESRFLTSLQRRKINLFQADFKKEDFRNNVCNSGDKEQIYTRSMQLAAEAAYISFVAHYLEYAGPTINSEELLNAASDLVAFIGLKNMPTLPRELATKLGV
jgi:superfamily II DNA/RNA helicase